MDLARYSELKAKGQITLSKKEIEVGEETHTIYTITRAKYDEYTGERVEDEVHELRAGNITEARQKLTDERDSLLAKRDALDELISDAQAL